MKITYTKTVTVHPTRIVIKAEIESITTEIVDDNKNMLASIKGKIPYLINDSKSHKGIFLDIDIETGRILNWNTPTAGQIQYHIDQFNKV